jgi:formate hydrogenlyase transcriptional activator
MMRAMASSGQGSERLNVQLLVDSIPALIHTARPDGHLDYFNKPWLEYLGVTLDKVAGWNWTAFIHPEDVDGIVGIWRACLATGEIFEYETRVRRANGDYRWMFHRKVPLRDANGNIVKWYGSSLDIEERKAAEEKIREQETELRKLLNLIPHHVCVFGPDASPIYANQGVQEYFGVDADQLVAESRINFVHPDDREHFLAERKKGLLTGVAHEGEARLLRHDGTFRCFLFRRIPLKDDRGHILRWYGTATDIEDRKRAEEKVKTSEFYLAEGQRLAHMGSWAFDPNGFYYWSPELFRMHGLDPAGKAPSVQEYLDRVHPHDRESMADLIKGVLAKASPFDATKRIVRPNGEVRYIRCVGAPVVENQCLKKYVGSAIDVTEHELLTQELRRREAYLTEAQRLSHTGSWAWNVRTGALFWSEEIFRIYGYSPQETGPTWEQLLQRVHAKDRPQVEQRAKMEAIGNEWIDSYGDFRIVLPDGTLKYLHSVAHPVTQSGEVTEVIGTVMDVTEQELLTQELRRREAYLAEAQKLSHTGSFGWKPDTGEIVWSDETYRIFEYDRSVNPTIDSVAQRVHPEDRADFQKVIADASRGATDFEHSYRLLLPDGGVKHVHAIAHVLQDASGNREFVGAVTDITERKAAEEALRSSEAYLAEAQRVSQTGSWAWSPDQDIRYWSEECYRVLSFDPQDGLPRFEDFFQRIHPDDQPDFRELTETAIREKAEWEADYRIVHPDGPVRDIHVLGHPVLSTSGHLIEFVGTVIDVTERKRAEEERRRSEMELRQMLDLAPQNIAVYGPNREPLYANRNLLDYCGLTLEKWRQRLDRGGVAHPDEWERVDRHFDRALASGAAFELEMRLRKSDGSFRWFLARYNPLHDEHGQIMRWYVAATDIEDRKQAEDKLRQENVALREEINKASMFEEIVGTSPALKSVLSRISKVAPTDSTVLITGETGTGKELVARAIHRRSDRASRAFVSVNCAAIPRDLIASELFGHEKGAFTGATQQRLGRFELANGGTIFLDEVGELPVETQIALLRVLQEHEFERVGGSRRIRADVRVIAATNRDLQAAISAGSFRSDLFYRLHVFPIEIPSLRERRADIPLLVEYFIDRYARKAGKDIKRVNKKTLELLQSYPWPGNIRELQNVIERSIILCETEVFSIDERWLPKQPSLTEPKTQVELPGRLLAQEREMIEAALKESRGRIFGPEGAAAKLGIPRSTLESKIRSLKINKNRFRPISGT